MKSSAIGCSVTLPANICSHPDGLLVRVQRRGVLFQAFVRWSHATPLTKALALRDRFLRIAGEPAATRTRTLGGSNTGISGVSETQTWRRGRPYPCFTVSWNERGHQTTRRVYYGHSQSRTAALNQAIALRSRMTGLVIPSPLEESNA
jgi:hypothetical protein